VSPESETTPVSDRQARGPLSLEAFMAEVKRKMMEAKPPERVRAAQAEANDPRLVAALAAARANPNSSTYRAVASEYARLGIVDTAQGYLERAIRLDPRDATAYDALARMWRDGGLSNRALADAYRAVFFAPRSPAVHNTLGTVFQALGRRADARRQYQRAIDLDASASYAANNLCYAWILEGQAQKAKAFCERAIALEPASAAARNNLALAYAAGGDMAAARTAFDGSGDRAAAEYNVGILQLARGRYRDAVTAFAAAQQIRPQWRQAAVRERQAERLAQAGAEE
jgi:Flp pilus assembly protein TadD